MISFIAIVEGLLLRRHKIQKGSEIREDRREIVEGESSAEKRIPL